MAPSAQRVSLLTFVLVLFLAGPGCRPSASEEERAASGKPAGAAVAAAPSAKSAKPLDSSRDEKVALEPRKDLDAARLKLLRGLVDAAVERTKHKISYTPKYFSIAYPGGDIPPELGVCTDVVVRAYRKVGIDLQKDVHEDMQAHFGLYPKIWALKRPDPNIDHRRVQNLAKHFERQGGKLPVTKRAADYLPGDIVTWKLASGQHIGIVVDRRDRKSGRNLVVHNIGAGPKMEDFLFGAKITGHYRHLPKAAESPDADKAQQD